MPGFVLPTKVYDFIRWLLRIVLPAFSALYFGLSGLWNLPNAVVVLGTVALVSTFLGACIGVSNTNFEGDGALVPIQDADSGKLKYSIELNHDLDAIPTKKQFVLKVNPVISADPRDGIPIK